MMLLWPRFVQVAAAGVLLALAGCSRPAEDSEPAATAPLPLRVQLDWLPQIELGGYYQAQAKGFYRAQGLEVELFPGGPGVPIKEIVGEGRAQLGATDGNGVLVAISRGLPLLIVGAEMQRNPNALMFHRTHPLRSFRDLDGRTLIASASMAWVDYLQRSQNVRFDLMPNSVDLTMFVADETLVRQCYVTQEPFLAARMGADVGTLMLYEADYDPYRVIYANRDFAARNPAVVRRFLAATIAGYNDLIEGDPAPAFAAISAANPAMTSELMQHSLQQMRALRLVEGRAEQGERTGRIVRERVARQIDQLRQSGQLARPLDVEDVARFDLLPAAGISAPATPKHP